MAVPGLFYRTINVSIEGNAMKSSNRSLKVALLSVVVAAAGMSLPWSPAYNRAVAAEEKVQKSELNNQMEDMDESFKKLKRTLRKSEQNAESLKLIADLQQKSVLCKGMVPMKAAKVPEAERAKFVTEYRKEMAGVIIQFCEMEQALLDNNNEKAIEIYKALVERQDKDHDQFMQKEEKKK
jgi:hypothetical protein